MRVRNERAGECIPVMPCRRPLKIFSALVVGADRGYENAVELAGTIIMDVYRETGTFQVRDYFLEKHRESQRKGHKWKGMNGPENVYQSCPAAVH